MSINTDDPVLLGASLEGEYALCSQAFGWTDEDLRALARNSIDASFANADVKARLLEVSARWRDRRVARPGGWVSVPAAGMPERGGA